MIWISIVLLVLAGTAEHFKDLSEEGKLEGYWDKNHKPMWRFRDVGGWVWDSVANQWDDKEDIDVKEKLNSYWWKVHWLQGGIWDKIPIWIRQYLSFRDGWHLLKFFSLNLWALAFAVLADTFWTGLVMFVLTRLAFSLPETILRPLNLWKNKRHN